MASRYRKALSPTSLYTSHTIISCHTDSRTVFKYLLGTSCRFKLRPQHGLHSSTPLMSFQLYIECTNVTILSRVIPSEMCINAHSLSKTIERRCCTCLRNQGTIIVEDIHYSRHAEGEATKGAYAEGVAGASAVGLTSEQMRAWPRMGMRQHLACWPDSAHPSMNWLMLVGVVVAERMLVIMSLIGKRMGRTYEERSPSWRGSGHR